ncbi:Flp pilus assembly complex ATPase component TadA, partial [Nostoc sp. CHAB 5834]|nr:Flp pilus assembly complex ATPase component TadA [Nostoc sp. CHAB 5834]
MVAKARLIATPEELTAAIDSRKISTPRIGELLLNARAVTAEALKAAISAKSVGSQGRLGDILVSMGAVNRALLEDILEGETGVPVVDLTRYPLNTTALTSLPASAAWMYKCFPFERVSGKLVVAFPEKPTEAHVTAVRFATGQPIFAVRAKEPDAFPSLLNRYFPNTATTLIRHPQFNAERYEEVTKSRETPAGFFRYLTALALNNRASDIHVRPQLDGNSKVLLRIDGRFQDLATVPQKDVAGLIRHIEVMAHIDFMKKGAPREGRLSFHHENRDIDLRVSVIQGVHGDSVVLRVFDPGRLPADLLSVGLNPLVRSSLTNLMLRPHGLFLVTGPTGSGKTTTLYTLLNELAAQNLHIVTLEDPVECKLRGINQIESADFNRMLAQVLRHDPDVIMVGELRDSQTVDMAINAALTGHLVLTTVHANDSAATVHRLLGLGASVSALGSCLVGVMSQRLVPIYCPQCAGAGCAN